ncbi:MAG: nitrate/nitrite transporter [Thermoplasmata archaeon]
MAKRRNRELFFGTTWVAIACLNAYIIAPAPVFPDLMASLQVGNAAAGALVSALLLSAIVAQVPGAYVIDRVKNSNIVAVSTLGLSAASLPAFLLHRYDVILASRFVAGLFVPLIFVASANLVGHAFPEKRVRALGAYLSAPPAGYALGTFATPYISSIGGLSFVFIAYALPLLILLPVIYWTSRGLGEDRGPMYPLREYIAAFRSPELWRLGLAFASTYAIYIFFTSWMPSFLAREGGLSLAAGGSLVALVPALGILSRPLGGYLADTVFHGDKRVVPIISFVVLLPLGLVWTAGASIPWAPLLLPLAGFFVQLPFSVYYAFSSQILPERLTGSAYTFMNTTSLIGGALAPYVAGYLVDATNAFQPAFYFAAGLAAIGLVLTLSSRER